jgi:hypothetical protein
MAFRRIYSDLLEAEKLTTVFRPGSRKENDFRGYKHGQIVTARVLDKVGADWAKIAPQFVPGFSKTIIISSLTTKELDKLVAEDFTGSSPDIYDIPSLRYHLGLIYNLSPNDLNGGSVVTRINFKYSTK